jgi:hypothetical protein
VTPVDLIDGFASVFALKMDCDTLLQNVGMFFSAIHGTTSNEVYMEKSIVKDGIDTPNSEITSDETSNEIDSRMQSAVAYVNRFIDELHVSMFLNVLNKNHFRSRNV